MAGDRSDTPQPTVALHHRRAIMEESGVSREIARERGYRTVHDAGELVALGFAERQRNVPALLVPVYSPATGPDSPALYQSRPDSPRADTRADQSEGKRIKYETPQGARMALDVHPAMMERAGDPNTPLWITEGIKKGDCLASRGLCALSLIGVWNWRGTNALGGKTALPDFEHVALNGRQVRIAFDSDVMRKSEVRAALSRLKAFVESRGAEVMLVYLPDAADGSKQGVDDYLVAGNTVDDLLSLATYELREVEAEPGTGGSEEIEIVEHLPVPITKGTDLLAKEFAPIQWAIPGIVPEGVTLLAGKPKMGKSWMVLGMCVAVASGGRALGSIGVTGGSALYLALEDGERRLQRRLKQVLGAEPCPESLDIATDWPRLNDGGTALLEQWLTDHPDARLIVIDTLKKIRPRGGGGNRNAYDEDYEALEPLLPLAAKHGVAILINHHLRKLPADDPLDEINSSMGLSGGVDGAVVLRRKRGDADAYLYVSGRDIEEEQELALRWNADTVSWNAEGDAEDHRLSRERRQILEGLRGLPEPIGPKDLADIIDADYAATRQTLYQMSKAGEVSLAARGKYFVSDQMSISANNSHDAANNAEACNSSLGAGTRGTNNSTHRKTPANTDKSNPFVSDVSDVSKGARTEDHEDVWDVSTTSTNNANNPNNAGIETEGE